MNSEAPERIAALEIERLRDLYIETIKRSVGDFIYDFDAKFTQHKQTAYSYVDLRTGARYTIEDYAELKQNGLTGSNVAHTIIGMKRLDQLRTAVETVLAENIPGDFIETGVLRGGACVLMRAILKAYDVTSRKVWVADSFQGFPLADGRRERPEQVEAWVATQDEVEQVFRNYQLLDEQVKILPGWFADTLPTAPIEELAILRLDGDLYVSTMQALESLYPKLAVGGYLIVDDYHAFVDCRKAVREYRSAHGIKTPLVQVDPVCVYWRKTADGA